ncbi:MAG: metalloregulator ArsR/SmtB family transcription factor [bacterium]|nr:metalloregulator ArsR/SmtB family transcription factor [bacterium]
MRRFLDITKALADESRVRALLALRGGELCVCQLIDLLGLAPSTVSKHMAILIQAGLILSRKDGRWHYCRLPGEEEAEPAVRAALDWLQAALGGCPVAKQDMKRLKEIRRKEKEEVSSCCYRN